MSRLRESELAYARTLRRAAEILDGTALVRPTGDERNDIAESLRDLAENMEGE